MPNSPHGGRWPIGYTEGLAVAARCRFAATAVRELLAQGVRNVNPADERREVHFGLERREVHFSGRVQGVGFRYTTRAIAQRYPVRGYVQNLPDGSVRLVVEGTAASLDALIAQVVAEMDRYIESTDVVVRPASGEFSAFEIRH